MVRVSATSGSLGFLTETASTWRFPTCQGNGRQALVNTARSDRLDFMKSAEAIWIVLDGRTLADINRQGLIARVGQLARRLNTMLDGHAPRLMIVVTHRDLHVLADNVVNRLRINSPGATRRLR